MKCRHGERQPRLQILPDPVHDLFEMADHREHGQHCLNEHAVIPLPPRAHFEIGGIPSRSMESRIAEDHHPSVTLPNQRLKSLVRDIGGGTIPCHDQPPLVPPEASCSTHTPAVV